jgi:hypothetical protein
VSDNEGEVPEGQIQAPPLSRSDRLGFRVRRWLGHPLLRRFDWQFSARYWTSRRRLQRAGFLFGRLAFRLRTRWKTQRESISILRGIVQALLAQLLLAAVLVIGLVFVDQTLIGPSRSFSGGVFSQLLAITAQIAGIFLGLYFTAVSVVASTAYARVPGEVRTLLMREKVGNLYIRTVAFLAGACVLLLAAQAMGFKPGVVSLAVIAFLAMAAILSFLVLGLRLFNFFDPTALVAYLTTDFLRWSQSATVVGFRRHDPSFQAHYQRQAQAVLATFKHVISLSLRQETVEGPILAELASRGLHLETLYGQHKGRIPTQSYWFRRVYRHRNWLTTDHIRTDLALKTGTGLDPESVPDPLWVEAEVAQAEADILERLITAKQFRDAIAVTEVHAQTLGSLGRTFAVDEAIQLQDRTARLVRAVGRANSVPDAPTEEEAQDFSLLLGLTDSYSSAVLSLLLGLSERLRATSAETLANGVDAVNWRKPKTAYGGGLPRKALEQLEYLKKGIETELAVERDLVSPAWYRHQIVALGFVRFLDTTVKRLIATFRETFPDEVETLVQCGQFVFAAQLLQRGLEAYNKLGHHLHEFEACFDRLATLRRVSDVPWVVIPWADHYRSVEADRQGLVVALGESAAGLIAVPRSPHWPDYFGQACVVLAEESYLAMASRNDDLFQKVFAAYFLAGLSAYDRLMKELEDESVETRIIFSSEPVQNLLDRSGWAIIYSELDGRHLWDTAKAMWDRYLSGQSDPQKTVEFINTMVTFRQSVFALKPGDIGRTAWTQDFGRRLRERGILSDDEFLFGPHRSPRHASPLIRVLMRGSGLMIDPDAVFLATYLLKRPEASGLESTRQVESFQEMFQREEERGTQPDDEEEDWSI